MLELKISSMYIGSYADFQKQNFDKNLIDIEPIHQDNHGMALDSALFDAILYIENHCDSILTSLLADWLMIQARKNNIPESFKLNGRKFLKEELKNKKLLNKILEEELKSKKLKNRCDSAT
ncbi:hypothetical protein [Acinetobacter boissieri]|uniref:Uncharacterized protein n=1 Tax=Acinetobacter boissieri TaxID=1219383 RepID=A0A1G6KKV4_9GAMM|nr:hypothetical protein [Acinetobacter boissieri]SDC30956.1 hypothetical protein SAMN05421733_1216 [Acinetobacter boissieri]